MGFLGSFGDHKCVEESSNLSPSKGDDCMQVCESERHNLGANWYQSVSDKRAQDTIIEEDEEKNPTGVSEKTEFSAHTKNW